MCVIQKQDARPTKFACHQTVARELKAVDPYAGQNTIILKRLQSAAAERKAALSLQYVKMVIIAIAQPAYVNLNVLRVSSPVRFQTLIAACQLTRKVVIAM